MIVHCAHCYARYKVDGASIGDGRTLRCAECGQSWWQDPAAGSAAENLMAGLLAGDAATKEDVPVDAAVAAPGVEKETGHQVNEVTDHRMHDETVTETETGDMHAPLWEDAYEVPPARGAKGLMILALLFCTACIAAVAYLLATGNPLARQVVSPVISVISTDRAEDGRNLRLSMRIANPTAITVRVPAIAVSVDDASGREQSQRRIPAPVGALRANGTVEAQVSVPKVERGERMRVGFVPD